MAGRPLRSEYADAELVVVTLIAVLRCGAMRALLGRLSLVIGVLCSIGAAEPWGRRAFGTWSRRS